MKHLEKQHHNHVVEVKWTTYAAHNPQPLYLLVEEEEEESVDEN